MSKDRILIADDSKLNRELLTAILGDKYDYVYAEDGLQTLDILSNNELIDIILLDIHMPNMDGFEVLKVLGEKQYLKEIPVVIISSEKDAGFVTRAYEMGATDYINRPFNASIVKHRVSNTLMLYSNQRRLIRLVQEQVFEREKINNSMINIFSNIIELRNHESGSHTLHVQTITSLLLHELMLVTDKYPLSETDISLYSSLSALHDIGKIKIPETILNKPGKLTAEEWNIMKTHSMEGYNILSESKIEQDNKFMKTAKAICRWHHEKYDGKGYPDGLSGDDIPICAQVVSLADVYDALTSERCYKRAYSHEEAIKMILNGECGSFNPLLLKCLKNISFELKNRLDEGIDKYDFHTESTHVVDEILANNNIYLANETHSLIAIEKEKQKFFEEKAATGISFEYDMILHKLSIINRYDKDKSKKVLYSVDRDFDLLKQEDYDLLIHKIHETTPEHNSFSFPVLLNIDGMGVWHRFDVKTLWLGAKKSMVEIIGQFTDIHESVLSKSLKKVDDSSGFLGTISSMKSVFPIVRLVDPISCEVLSLNEEGQFVSTKTHCFEIWNQSKPCQYCSSKEALDSKDWLSKLEVKEGKIYAVLSKYIKILNKDCVLEFGFPVEDGNLSSNMNRTRLMSSILFINFYKDSLTRAYTRTYLEDFSSNLDNAQGVAVLDVDKFKKINDNYGHPIGDIVLKEIAKRIFSCIKDEGVVIRYGGDEFLIIFDKIEKDKFFSTLKRIQDSVSKIQINQVPDLHISISAGGCYNGKSLITSISKADSEMYKEKARLKEMK